MGRLSSPTLIPLLLTVKGKAKCRLSSAWVCVCVCWGLLICVCVCVCVCVRVNSCMGKEYCENISHLWIDKLLAVVHKTPRCHTHSNDLVLGYRGGCCPMIPHCLPNTTPNAFPKAPSKYPRS